MQADEYTKMAEVEDHMWYYAALHRHVTRSLALVDRPVGQPVRLLDAGCGTGGLLRKIKAAFPAWKLTGMDFSVMACELAAKRAGVEIAEGTVLAMPFSGSDFDVLVSCDVLCQVSTPEIALREFFRCLRPGGLVVLTMPAYQWLYSYHDREVANLKRYTRPETDELVNDAGFEIVCSTYWNSLPFPLAVIKRKLLPSSSAKSDVKAFPVPIEACFNGLMAIEHGWLALGGRLPFGTSVLTVARKPSDHHANPAP